MWKHKLVDVQSDVLEDAEEWRERLLGVIVVFCSLDKFELRVLSVSEDFWRLSTGSASTTRCARFNCMPLMAAIP